MAVLFRDDFNGVNNTSLDAHVPDVRPGSVMWVERGSTTFEVLGGRAHPTAGIDGNHTTVDLGIADQLILEASLTVGSSSSTIAREAGVLVRWRSDTQFIYAGINDGLNTFHLMSRDGTTYTELAAASVAIVAGTYYTVTVILDGSTITARLNGANEISAVTTLGQTSTVHGLKLRDAGSYAEWVQVDTIEAAVDTVSPAALATGAPVLGAPRAVTYLAEPEEPGEITAGLAAGAGALGGSAAGSVAVSGAVSASMGLGVSAAGSVEAQGSLAQAAGRLGGAAMGSLSIRGTLSGSPGATRASAQVHVLVSGAASSAAGSTRSQASGSAGDIPGGGRLAASAGLSRIASTARVDAQGSLAQAAGRLGGSAAGAVAISGAVSAALGMAVAALGVSPVGAALSGAMGAARVVAVARVGEVAIATRLAITTEVAWLLALENGPAVHLAARAQGIGQLTLVDEETA